MLKTLFLWATICFLNAHELHQGSSVVDFRPPYSDGHWCHLERKKSWKKTDMIYSGEVTPDSDKPPSVKAPSVNSLDFL